MALGGITHSGGMIFCGLIVIMFTMVYNNTWLVYWCFSLYVITLILEAALQPYLTPDPAMTESKNLLMFVINSLWMSATILWLIFYTFGKDAELARLKAERLEEADELKTRLFANIAHEFRTPLTLISGMADLIHDNPHLQIRERTGMIQRNADKVLRLVDQMLNLSRLESGAMPVNAVQSDVTSFLSYVFHSYQGLSEYRQVRIHFLPEVPHLVMDFDPEKLEELVGNLLSNALKYTPAGGNVYLSFHNTGHDPESLVITVRDTGIGIPDDKLNFIFDRFYRIESAEKHYEEGSGIGLTLVREYVKLMGGEIKVKSKLGEGTEFTVILPITRLAPVHQSVIPDSPPDLSGENQLPEMIPDPGNTDATLPQLLVIEDNPEVIQYLCLILGEKFRILTAGNGDDGIQQALEHIPDLIISDVMMPGKDGFEVCRAIKKDFRTCHIPVVLLSARADRASRIAGLGQGADAYMTKPFNKKELLLCLHNQLIQREKLRIKYSGQAGEHEHEPTSGYNELFLKNLRKVLEEKYSDDSFGIEELCDALSISRVQLHRKLIALTGQSASHFIRTFRLVKAKEMLMTTSKSVSEIAYETGFSDANYFSRVFSQEFGKPPSALRRGHETPV
jgi:signal transduction histidine kinase/DNA-binding response OmpR family regulator